MSNAVLLPNGPNLNIPRQLVVVVLTPFTVLRTWLCSKQDALLLGVSATVPLILGSVLAVRRTDNNTWVCTRQVLAKLLPKVTVPARLVTVFKGLEAACPVPFTRN